MCWPPSSCEQLRSPAKCLQYGIILHLHLEGEDGVDDGPEAAVGEARQDVAAEGGDELGLVLGVPSPEQRRVKARYRFSFSKAATFKLNMVVNKLQVIAHKL